MRNRQFIILGSGIGLLCVVGLWHLITGWGLVTVHVRNADLSKVIASIERQSGVKIVTNVDASTPVAMDVDRVPAAQAVTVLANRIDGNWRIVYVLASSLTASRPALDALQAGERRPKDWKSFSSRGRQGFFPGQSETVVDPRETQWKISVMPDMKVQAFLDQFSQKTGLTTYVPEGWNPEVTKTIKNGQARITIPALAKSVGGISQEIFFVTKSNRNQDRGRTTAASPQDSGGDTGSGRSASTRPETNPEWAKERIEVQIALLPASEQDAARKEQEQMQKTSLELRDLPADQRQVKLAQMMSDPANQAQADERAASAQDRQSSSRSPEQRANRYRAYVENKQAAQAAAPQAKP